MISRIKNVMYTNLILFSALLFTATSAFSGPITTEISVTASSTEANGGKVAKHLVDRSGLTETFPGSGIFVHNNDPFAPPGSMWDSGYLPDGADHTPTLIFDLFKTYTLDAFHVWNYNEKGWTSRGFNSVEVATSSDGKQYEPAGVFSFDQADGSNDYEGQDFRLKTKTTARFVRFHALSTYRGDDVAGLSSVEFHATGVGAPPERTKAKAAVLMNLKPKYTRPALPKPLHGAPLLGQEDIVFPQDAKVIDLSQPPYNAKGDGITDDTQAIQQALIDYSSSGSILYLPNGVYLVTTTLKWPLANGKGNTSYGFETLQGQSRNGTVLLLKDATFSNADRPKPLLGFGAHGSADYFANSVRNLTIDTGLMNPGAIGLQFYSNNMGCVRDVTIQSGDGYGKIGLDLGYNDMNGPMLIKNVKVVGYDVGVQSGFGVNSQTMEHVLIQNQNQFGVVNGGQCLSIRDLKSVNTVPAIANRSGLLTLVDSTLNGAGLVAVQNDGGLYVRNLITTGYATAITNTTGSRQCAVGPKVAEFISAPVVSLFPSPPHALGLPIEETPEVPWDKLTKWANVEKFKQPGDKDDTAGIQAAIDSGAATVYFPHRAYKISNTILVRKNVQRLIGCTATVEVPEGVSPGFKLVAGSKPVVVFERIDSGYTKSVTLENASDRALVVKDCTNVCGNMTGEGSIYIENVCSNPFTNWTFAKQKVWARQFNVENQGTHIRNDGGTLWILGLKTERGGTLIETLNLGKTQLDGGFCYTTTDPKGAPMFINNDSSVSLTLGEANFGAPPYAVIVREIRGTETKSLNNPDPRYDGQLRLYTGYTGKDGVKE